MIIFLLSTLVNPGSVKWLLLSWLANRLRLADRLARFITEWCFINLIQKLWFWLAFEHLWPGLLKLCIMVVAIKLYSLLPISITFTFIHGYKCARKLSLSLKFLDETAWNLIWFWDMLVWWSQYSFSIIDVSPFIGYFHLKNNKNKTKWKRERNTKKVVLAFRGFRTRMVYLKHVI